MEFQAQVKKILDSIKCIRENSIKCCERTNNNLTDIITEGEEANVTLLAINASLQALLAETKIDFEMASVIDSNGDIYQLVFEKDETTGAVVTSYIDADGNIAVPVGAVEFVSPNTLLAGIQATLDNIEDELIEINKQKTAVSLNTTGAFTIPIGASEISVFAMGGAGGGTPSLNGSIVPRGVTRNYGQKNEIDTAMSGNGNGRQVLIDYMI